MFFLLKGFPGLPENHYSKKSKNRAKESEMHETIADHRV